MAGMCGRGCMAGGCAWQGAYMAGGMHDRAACIAGVHMAGGFAWQEGAYTEGACVVKGVHAGEMATEAGSTHLTGMYSCTTSNKVAAR